MCHGAIQSSWRLTDARGTCTFPAGLWPMVAPYTFFHRQQQSPEKWIPPLPSTPLPNKGRAKRKGGQGGTFRTRTLLCPAPHGVFREACISANFNPCPWKVSTVEKTLAIGNHSQFSAPSLKTFIGSSLDFSIHYSGAGGWMKGHAWLGL